MNLCPYKNIFGAVGTGPHSYRLFNIAVVDVVATLIGAWLLSYSLDVPFWWMATFLFLLGIFLHRAFCVRTTVDQILFP